MGASVDQLSHEVKAMDKDDRQSLLVEASVHDATATISPSDILAMKSDLCIPWNKFRRYHVVTARLVHVKVTYLVQMDESMEDQPEHRSQGSLPFPFPGQQ